MGSMNGEGLFLLLCVTVVLRSLSAALRSRIRVATGQPVLGPDIECVRYMLFYCSQDERKALPHSDNENTSS